MNLREPLTVGAFMAIGLQHAIDKSRGLLDHWGCGHYELVNCMMEHAPYCEALLEAGFKLVQRSCGVAVYEVAEEFGAWYGEQVLQAAPMKEPDANACRAKLRVLVTAFYNPMNSADLGATLNAVPIPDVDVAI